MGDAKFDDGMNFPKYKENLEAEKTELDSKIPPQEAKFNRFNENKGPDHPNTINARSLLDQMKDRKEELQKAINIFSDLGKSYETIFNTIISPTIDSKLEDEEYKSKALAKDNIKKTLKNFPDFYTFALFYTNKENRGNFFTPTTLKLDYKEETKEGDGILRAAEMLTKITDEWKKNTEKAPEDLILLLQKGLNKNQVKVLKVHILLNVVID